MRPSPQAAKPEPADPGEFTSAQWSRVEAVIEAHREKPGALIPVLEEIQQELGHVPDSVQERVASGLNLPLAEIRGVVTFYHFFNMFPRGRHTVRCCMGTACYVRGGRRNLAEVLDRLKVEEGGTTADRRYSVETVRCLGACGLAPVVMVDEETFKQVKPTNLVEILSKYE